VVNVGNAADAVVQGVVDQVGRFTHTCFMITPYEGYVAVCEELARLTPGDHELDPNVEPDWERSMRRLAVRNQVLAIEVVDRREIEFPDVGDMLIRDPETDFERYVNTADPDARARMDAASAAQRERIRIALRRAGVGHIQLRTDRDWVQDIARFVLAYRRVASMLHAPPQGVAK